MRADATAWQPVYTANQRCGWCDGWYFARHRTTHCSAYCVCENGKQGWRSGQLAVGASVINTRLPDSAGEGT